MAKCFASKERSQFTAKDRMEVRVQRRRVLMPELGFHHGQRRRDHYVTLWHSVTVLTLPRTSFASTALLKAR